MKLLKAGQLCWLHRSYFCCGREENKKRDHKRHYKSGFESGVTILPDGRERRSPAAMRRLLLRKIEEQNGFCAIGGELFTDLNDIVADHINPKGNGGAFRDDSPKNIQAACNHHNLEKGSKRNYRP